MTRRRAQKRAEAEARHAATPPDRRRRHRLPCPSGKHKYATEHEAAVELVGTIVSRNRGHNQRRECRSYECNLCGQWHLTSSPLRRSA